MGLRLAVGRILHFVAVRLYRHPGGSRLAKTVARDAPRVVVSFA